MFIFDSRNCDFYAIWLEFHAKVRKGHSCGEMINCVGGQVNFYNFRLKDYHLDGYAYI